MEKLNNINILLVDDDKNFQKVTSYLLESVGGIVTTADNGLEALEFFRDGGSFDVILSDVRMPKIDGLALLNKIREIDKSVPFILITAHGDVEMAVQAMQAGATDFITKPFECDRLVDKIMRSVRLPQLEQENRTLREELSSRYSFDSIIGSSHAMRQMLDLMSRVLNRDTTILILGESGTGKEVVARALHYSGPRAKGHFVAINCAAFQATLLESELFGHVKGAFTGADQARDGRILMASGGTLFLDEIGDMPLELQVKLLRVLQERCIEPVGSNKSYPVDVRVITATHRDLSQLVRAGEFREDLFYRLNVVPLHIPPLRDRREDIPLLARHFLKRFGNSDVNVDHDAMELLMNRNWPGNVRELENTIERALALRAHKEKITVDDFRFNASLSTEKHDWSFEIPDSGIILDDVEKQLIENALVKTGNNQTRAAQILGITRQKLIYRMQKYGIE